MQLRSLFSTALVLVGVTGCSTSPVADTVAACTRDCAEETLQVARKWGAQAGFYHLEGEILHWIIARAPELDPGERPLPRPTIIFVDPADIQRGWFAQPGTEIMGEFEKRARGHIRLRNDWTYTDGVSVLVHELIHHLQAASGWMDGRCARDIELMAYQLQFLWQMEHGYLDAGYFGPFRRLQTVPCEVE